jgi:transcriptional regulator with XRE-family HTH domain
MTSHLAPATTSSVVPRRVLGRYLRDLRMQSGLTVKAAATIMEWSEPKLWRIETGQTGMRAMDVEAMCAVYRAPAELTRALVGLARQTKADGWWHCYDDVTPEQFSIYATLEEAATGLLVYASSQVPALLRTEAYARALITGSGPSTADIDQLVRSCISRQTLVTRGNPPLPVTVVLRETLVRCPVGGAAVMAEQLRHLAEMAGLPNVCLRVLPSSAGMHPGLVTGSFTLLQFPPSGPESDAAVVHAASLTGELFLDKPGEIRCYREAHATMLGCSLDEITTQDLLRAAANELDQ